MLQGHASQHIFSARLLLFTPPYLCSMVHTVLRLHSATLRTCNAVATSAAFCSLAGTGNPILRQSIAYRGHNVRHTLGAALRLTSVRPVYSLTTPRWHGMPQRCAMNIGENGILQVFCLIFLLDCMQRGTPSGYTAVSTVGMSVPNAHVYFICLSPSPQS